MGSKRDTYTYQFKLGNRIVHGGITKDPTRREQELKREIAPNGHLTIIGRAKTEDSARDWEKEKGYG